MLYYTGVAKVCKEEEGKHKNYWTSVSFYGSLQDESIKNKTYKNKQLWTVRKPSS